jgi:hypothetical protein
MTRGFGENGNGTNVIIYNSQNTGMGFSIYRDVSDNHHDLAREISCIMNRRLNFSSGIKLIFVV